MANTPKKDIKKRPVSEPGVRRVNQTKRQIIAEPEFVCCCCGVKYHEQKNNFYKSTSILYRGNNEFLPICRRCMDDLYSQYLASTGDSYEALRIIARQWDLFLNDSMYKRIAKVAIDRSRVGELIRYNGLAPHKGKNYDDYERDERNRAAEAEDEDEEKFEFEVTPEIIERWGTIYTKSEYQLLEEHYHSFDDQKTEGDIVQEKLLLQLCRLYKMQVDCEREKNREEYSKLVKSYQDTLKNGNFKPIQKGGDLNDEEQCWGVFLKQAEAFNPVTLYQDHQYGVDVDDLGKYYDRFVKRPIRNYLLGTNEQDEEYFIAAGDSDE